MSTLPRPLLNQLTRQNLSSSPFPSLLSPLQLSHSQVFYLSKYIFAMSDFAPPPLQPPPSIDSPLASIWNPHSACVWLCGLVYENKHALCLCVCFRLSKWSLVLLGHPRIHLALLSSSETNPERVFRLCVVVLFSYFSTMLSVTAYFKCEPWIPHWLICSTRPAGAETPFILQSNPISPPVLIPIFVIWSFCLSQLTRILNDSTVVFIQKTKNEYMMHTFGEQV